MRCVARAGAGARPARIDARARGKANGPSLGRRAQLVALVATTTATRGRAEEAGGTTIAEALRAAKPGDRIALDPASSWTSARRRRRRRDDRDGGGGPKATVRHVTPAPYESAIEIRARGVTIRNLAVAHGSKSVANNHGIFSAEERRRRSSRASDVHHRERVRDRGRGGGVDRLRGERVRVARFGRVGRFFGRPVREPSSGTVRVREERATARSFEAGRRCTCHRAR